MLKVESAEILELRKSTERESATGGLTSGTSRYCFGSRRLEKNGTKPDVQGQRQKQERLDRGGSFVLFTLALQRSSSIELVQRP